MQRFLRSICKVYKRYICFGNRHWDFLKKKINSHCTRRKYNNVEIFFIRGIIKIVSFPYLQNEGKLFLREFIINAAIIIFNDVFQ